MTKININRNIYVYGKFYDPHKVRVPKGEEDWTGLIVYVHPLEETSRIIGSLEGYFYSKLPLPNKSGNNPLVQRTDMKLFEEKYQGKFFPFDSE
jgi:hypothetical protein